MRRHVTKVINRLKKCIQSLVETAENQISVDAIHSTLTIHLLNGKLLSPLSGSWLKATIPISYIVGEKQWKFFFCSAYLEILLSFS